MIVFALLGELLDHTLQFREPQTGGVDRHTVLTAWISAGLARIEPVLHGPGQEAVGYIPPIGLLITVCLAVPELYSAMKYLVENLIRVRLGILHI